MQKLSSCTTLRLHICPITLGILYVEENSRKVFANQPAAHRQAAHRLAVHRPATHRPAPHRQAVHRQAPHPL